MLVSLWLILYVYLLSCLSNRWPFHAVLWLWGEGWAKAGERWSQTKGWNDIFLTLMLIGCLWSHLLFVASLSLPAYSCVQRRPVRWMISFFKSCVARVALLRNRLRRRTSISSTRERNREQRENWIMHNSHRHLWWWERRDSQNSIRSEQISSYFDIKNDTAWGSFNLLSLMLILVCSSLCLVPPRLAFRQDYGKDVSTQLVMELIASCPGPQIIASKTDYKALYPNGGPGQSNQPITLESLLDRSPSNARGLKLQ